MQKPSFGKKAAAPPPSPPSPPPGGGGEKERSGLQMPWWDTEDRIAGNLAYAHLTNNLPIRVAIDDRLHAETLLAAAGAVCGYCCQRAVLERVDAGEKFEGDRLLRMRLANGHSYRLGDALTELFYGGPGPVVPANENLWRMLSGTAVAHPGGNFQPDGCEPRTTG